MEWTGCGETPQTDEEELEGKIAATDLRESMEKSKEFWGDTQYDDKTVIPANLLKCPPCCDENNIVAASQLAHIAWETMSQCDFEEMAKINRDLLTNGEIAANHLIPRIDRILKNTMDVHYMKAALEKVDNDYQQAVTLVANQLLYIFDENIPPRIVEDDLETNAIKQTGAQVSPYGNANAKNVAMHKDIKTRIKDLMELALENGLGEIKVPKASYVNDRAKLAILEKQIKGRLRLKHIIESGASKSNSKSSPEDLNKSSYNQSRGHKILDLSKRLKSAKAMREKVRSKGNGMPAVGDQKNDEKLKLSREKHLIKSPYFTSHSTNNILTQAKAGTSKSDIVFSTSATNNDKNAVEGKLTSSSKVKNVEYLETVENKDCCCNSETSTSVKNLSHNYRQEYNTSDGQIVVEKELQSASLSARNSREPSTSLSVPSSLTSNNLPIRELQDELDLINSCNTQDEKITDVTLKDLLKEKSFKDIQELSKENLYLKNILQKRDLSLKVIRESNNDGDLKLKEKIIDFSPKAIIESTSDISPLYEKQAHLTLKEKPTMIQSDSALKNLLENSKGDLLMKNVEERVNDSFRDEIMIGSSLIDTQNSKIDSTPTQISMHKSKEEANDKCSQEGSSLINLTKSHSDSLKNLQNLDYTLNETQNTIKNKGDSSMNDVFKNELNIDETKNKLLINTNMNEIEKSKDLSLILRETMTQVHAKTNFIFTSPPPPSYSRSFNNITSNTNNNSSAQSKNNDDEAESNNFINNSDSYESEELKNMNTNVVQNETEEYSWLPDLENNARLHEVNLGEMGGGLNDETVEEARGGDADGENDFEFDFDVDDIIERNKFLEIEEIRRHNNKQSNNNENMSGMELELEKLSSEQKNVNLCHDVGNVQMQMKDLMNDGQKCIDNNEECNYQQFPSVTDKVKEMQQTEENIQDFEGGDSFTKIQEYMGEESLKDNLGKTASSNEVVNNNDEVEDDEETVEDEDQEEEDEETEEEEEEEDDDDDDDDDDEEEEEETESTMEEISSKSASIAAKSESIEVNLDTAEQSSQSVAKEEVNKVEEIDAKGKKGRTSRGGGDNSLLYITVFLGVFTATYFSDFGRHFFSNAVFTTIKSNAVSCLDRAINAMTALKAKLQQG